MFLFHSKIPSNNLNLDLGDGYLKDKAVLVVIRRYLGNIWYIFLSTYINHIQHMGFFVVCLILLTIRG